ncbi:DNA-binding transcriptional regulator, MarR family [Frankineae bacterium MT45]|nr:DNA-binding transcriptional regulator, MarR family [Frankineae bacterium MT45]
MAPSDFASSPSFLLSQVGALSAQRFAAATAPCGLTPRELAVLRNILDLGPRTQQQLADELGMHRNNMVSLIDELERKGLARRVRSTTDRRAFDIEVTQSGRSAAECVSQLVPTLDSELVADLSRGERSVLIDLLTRIADAAGLTSGVHPHLSSRR